MIITSDEFYPTPENLRDKLWEDFIDYEEYSMFRKSIYKFKNKENGYHVLEPSAGIGSLLLPNLIVDNLILIERDYDLFLKLKNEINNNFRNYKIELLNNDFLETDFKNRYINLIVMNPPFSNGVDHLLYAWNILTEGEIRCILPESSIDRSVNHRNRNLLLNIINANGSIEYLGSAFENAERKTKVKVVIVKLSKISKEGFKFKFDFDSKNIEFKKFEDDEFSNETLPKNVSVIKDKVLQYENAIEAYKEFLKAFSKIEFYLNDLTNMSMDELTNGFNFNFKDHGLNDFINFNKRLNKSSWDKLFNSEMFNSILTSGVKRDFLKFCETQSNVDFNEKNINNFMMQVINNYSNIMNRVLIEVFDRFTRYDKTNVVHVEGWLTNDAYKLNEKVILPYLFTDSFSLYLNDSDFIRDLDLVFCKLKGLNYKTWKDENCSVDKIRNIFSTCDFNIYGKWYDTYFYEIKFFKKRTTHIRFKDLDLLDEFNFQVAKGKNWLPDGYKERRKKGLL